MPKEHVLTADQSQKPSFSSSEIFLLFLNPLVLLCQTFVNNEMVYTVFLTCRSRFIYEGYKLEEGEGSGKTRQRGRAGEKTELNADEIKQHFRQLWTWDRDLLTKMFPMLAGRYTAGGPDEEYPTDVFFVDCLAVPPPRARPCQFTGGAITLHPQSTALNNVIESITVMKQVLQVVQGGLLFY